MAGVDVYMSFYLDRLIDIDEQKYLFALNAWFYLSWVDERAPGAVADATAAAQAPGGACNRLCNGQRAFSAVSRCCDAPLWLPSIVFRNVDEFPQGRAQPYYIDVSETGAVTWRVEVRSSYLTTLDVSAFPFDTQSLDMIATLSNYPGQGAVRVIPSATGLGLFTFGTGDDLSGWHAKDVHIFVRNPANYSSVFSSEQVARRQVSVSAPGDPVPLVPSNSPAALAARGGAPAPPRFGEGIGVVEITVSISVERLWLYFSLSAILPIVVCTSIAFLAFWVHPADLSTRLSLVVGLFLALVAVQFVLDGELPKASYVIPTRRLVIASYIALAVIAIETLVVANVVDWPRVRSNFHGQARALARRAELKRAALDLERSTRGGNAGARRTSSGAGGGSAAERGWTAAVARLTTLAQGGSGGRGAASAGLMRSPRPPFAAPAGAPPPPQSPPPMSGLAEEGGQAAASRAASKDLAPSSPPPPPFSRWPLGPSGGLAGGAARPPAGGGRRPSEAVLMEADLEAGYYAWLAWVIDMASFGVICALYSLTAVLIFVVARAQEPDLCARSGLSSDCLGQTTKHHRG